MKLIRKLIHIRRKNKAITQPKRNERMKKQIHKTNKANKAKDTEYTKDAVSILHRDIIGNDPKKLAMLEQERLNSQVAGDIYKIRTKAKLTQEQLANKIGSTKSVISRLEDADYPGHSLSMLHRIAFAVGQVVEVRFKSRPKKATDWQPMSLIAKTKLRPATKARATRK